MKYPVFDGAVFRRYAKSITKTSVRIASIIMTRYHDCDSYEKMNRSGRLAIERIAIASMKNS